jgi:hypothetical protein
LRTLSAVARADAARFPCSCTRCGAASLAPQARRLDACGWLLPSRLLFETQLNLLVSKTFMATESTLVDQNANPLTKLVGQRFPHCFYGTRAKLPIFNLRRKRATHSKWNPLAIWYR